MTGENLKVNKMKNELATGARTPKLSNVPPK